MKPSEYFKNGTVALFLLLGVTWAFSSAIEKEYPNDQFLVSAEWLKEQMHSEDVVIVDVRSDEHFKGGVIPGSVHMPWSVFRKNDLTYNLASVFVGVTDAQKILGQHGIARNDTVVLYDSVARDGGATASYVFWVLDILGHEKKMILERGIDSWVDAGYERLAEAEKPHPLFYQAKRDSVKQDKIIGGKFIYDRLGDPFYQIIDVRSEEEYLGEAGTRGLDGNPLKLGHIPTAVNINYELAWRDAPEKAVKSYAELLELYRGIDPGKGVIVYCNSGRRSSFSYFILRLMGVENVYTYEPSWKEWGEPANYYPVEKKANILSGDSYSGAVMHAEKMGSSKKGSRNATSDKDQRSSPSGGYVSCGG